ncbi:sugar phosphate isomerase/epimerase family protein [Paenibacillus sp. NPDC057934]|uniref:sugar phosphate isomerase/epimerase family protein n=1 Tax=Paenibacillus sp. NPDC057934 TaxID=3346282 RepID=UPI0036D88485
MLKGLTIWAFPGGLLGRTRVQKAAEIALTAGFDGLELSLTNIGDISFRSKTTDIVELRKSVNASGLKMFSLSTLLFHDYSLSSHDEDVVKKAMEIANKMLELAALLEIPSITISPGIVNEEDYYNDCYSRSVERIGILLKRAEEYGIELCIENVFNKFLLSPLEMKSFLDMFSSRQIGMCLDVGNARLTGYPEHWVHVLKQYIRKIHVTDLYVTSPFQAEMVEVGQGHVNWDAVLGELRKVNFQGPMIAEVFDAKDDYYMNRISRISKFMHHLEMGWECGEKINTNIKPTSG